MSIRDLSPSARLAGSAVAAFAGTVGACAWNVPDVGWPAATGAALMFGAAHALDHANRTDESAAAEDALNGAYDEIKALQRKLENH